MAHINKGWISLEMSLGLTLIVVCLAAGTSLVSQFMDNQEWNTIAQKSAVISDAAQRYIADNYSSLVSQSAPGKALPVTVATLISSGYLRTGYSDTNTYDQQYEAVVVQNSKQPEQIDSYVITQNGQPLTDKGMRTVASRINGMGGYTKNNQAIGAMSGWQFPLSQIGLNIPDGHLVIDLTSGVLNSASEESDRLYRYKVNTRPELNTMHTGIDMGGNDINNGGAVNAATGTYSSDVKSTGGWFITDDSKGWTNETHGGGFYMDDDNWVKSLNGKGIMTSGELDGGTVRAEGRLSAGEVLQLDQVNTAGASCSLNGLLSHDSDGAALSCIDGIWSSPGGGWKLPPPQTISCKIDKDTFEAKVDGSGTFWTSYRGSAWAQGEYINTQNSAYAYDISIPTVVSVSVSGLMGQEPVSSCETVSHGEQHCSTPVVNNCFAAWKY
ncbi:shufflon system plasmid conjugative transfer pilus tip adhesin PilV [Citrobacter koseri]|uniref:shufflon system plasmid conjugative transfer pilus tip adhesin PilV n=1 Tax=Citrobacter koseri TaxID=545 RepID=UPI001F1BF357|nr:shufflon system plasmid conjugative transfer pilus tip adhesin PilV [Citrobacter koseri]